MDEDGWYWDGGHNDPLFDVEASKSFPVVERRLANSMSKADLSRPTTKLTFRPMSVNSPNRLSTEAYGHNPGRKIRR